MKSAVSYLLSGFFGMFGLLLYQKSSSLGSSADYVWGIKVTADLEPIVICFAVSAIILAIAINARES